MEENQRESIEEIVVVFEMRKRTSVCECVREARGFSIFLMQIGKTRAPSGLLPIARISPVGR
ncbi:unnamed protein product [Arabis nemorensis]|uniref:Uncharacterized protein n=1 Tax=Arabis nemorensis TaxID=586526 RepID=A0A565BLS6_9BRAS|nr:unnamed protein product [Arabis nemorensis]